LTDTQHRSGFVGIIGPPNVGKSTLLNRLLEQKIAITSDKPQTTRHRILGVWTGPDAQIVFFDTPGLHQGSGLLNRHLTARALSVLPDVDLILFMIEPGRPEDEARPVIEALREREKTVILVINKIDQVRKEDLLPLMDRFSRELPLAALVPISALKGENLKGLIEEIKAHLPPGPRYYPPDTVTDQPERFIAAEMIREEIFRLTGQEIPYSTAITVEAFKEDRPDLIKIQATIHVERPSQKGIIIGKQGQKIKQIGTAARKDIERLTGTKVFLQLFVRVQKNWSKDPRALRRFGYEQE